MNDQQEDKLSMYLAVIAACEAHLAAWQDFVAFGEAFGEFESQVGDISTAAAGQQTGIRGATEEKRRAREKMTDLGFPIGAALNVWARLQGDEQLARRVYRSRNAWGKLRDTVVLTQAGVVLKEAQAHVAELGGYDITPEKIDALSSAIDKYRACMVKPRGAITDRKTATAELKKAFANADDLLKNRLDKLLPIRAAAQPAFAADYRNARIIVDTGKRAKP